MAAEQITPEKFNNFQDVLTTAEHILQQKQAKGGPDHTQEIRTIIQESSDLVGIINDNGLVTTAPSNSLPDKLKSYLPAVRKTLSALAVLGGTGLVVDHGINVWNAHVQADKAAHARQVAKAQALAQQEYNAQVTWENKHTLQPNQPTDPSAQGVVVTYDSANGQYQPINSDSPDNGYIIPGSDTKNLVAPSHSTGFWGLWDDIFDITTYKRADIGVSLYTNSAGQTVPELIVRESDGLTAGQTTYLPTDRGYLLPKKTNNTNILFQLSSPTNPATNYDFLMTKDKFKYGKYNFQVVKPPVAPKK